MSKTAEFDLSEVKSMRDRKRRFKTVHRLRHSPEALWPFLSNTDMLNKKSGMGVAKVDLKPRPDGGSLIHAKQKSGGFMMEYDEIPYQWVSPQQFRVERIMYSGPFRYFSFGMELADDGNGGTVATVETHYIPRWVILPYEMILKKIHKGFDAIYHEIDDSLDKHQFQSSWSAFLEIQPDVSIKREDLLQAWSRIGSPQALLDKVATFILEAPDRFLVRIRPFELAESLGVDRLELLHFLLFATREGYFNMEWNVLCPECRGTPKPARHLKELENQVHCPSCRIDFGPGFDENVEVSFQPTDKIRKLTSGAFCMGSPSNTTHIKIQQVVEPGQIKHIDLSLGLGIHTIHCKDLPGDVRFNVTLDGLDSLEFATNKQVASDTNLQLKPNAVITLSNPSDHIQVYRIAREPHRDLAATAAFITSLQDFRDLFSSEVLRPGMQLSVSNMVILFSDLKDSTRLYEMRGDAPAFSLVQDHFDVMIKVIRDNQGGIVKTIGDAVMAVFTTNSDSLTAALQVLEQFRAWNAVHPPEQHIIIKLGIHRGPCLALNLNGKLDYFGQTVNKAARVQGVSEGDDLVISAELYEDGETREFLMSHPDLKVEEFSASLKGISSAAALHRIRL